MNYLFRFSTAIAVVGLIALSANADENASGGELLDSETVNLAGIFDHGAGAGNADNSVTTATFTGGFNATNVRISGTLTQVQAATFGSEADIILTSPVVPPAITGISFTWQNPSANAATVDFDSSQDLTGGGFGGPGGTVDPAGDWDLEFIDTFDDGAGADAQSSNVAVTFEELTAINDSDGTFTLGSIGLGGTAETVGEFAIGGLFDTYDITLADDGILSLFTEANADGFTGIDADTEIGIFDSAGVLIANDDDGGTDLFSGLFDLELTAGDYQIVVGTFNTVFADGPNITPGAGTGDYALNVSLVTAVPEPSALAFLLVGFCGLGLRRRQNR